MRIPARDVRGFHRVQVLVKENIFADLAEAKAVAADKAGCPQGNIMVGRIDRPALANLVIGGQNDLTEFFLVYVRCSQYQLVYFGELGQERRVFLEAANGQRQDELPMLWAMIWIFSIPLPMINVKNSSNAGTLDLAIASSAR